MFKTILVPLDGSPAAESVLSTAVGMARNSGGKLLLLRAVEKDILGFEIANEQVGAVDEADDYLREVVARLAGSGFSNVETTVWYGSPVQAIVETARSAGVDLIAMTTHGRSGIGSLLLGSVTQAVLHGTRTPVLLVRTPGAPVKEPADAAPARRR